jgi:hypothetical protein
MNNLGKERIALEMANTAANILLKQEKVISLQWKIVQENSMSMVQLKITSPYKKISR